MAPITSRQKTAPIISLKDLLENISTLKHLSGCVCGKGKCKKCHRKYNALSHGPPSTTEQVTAPASPKVGSKKSNPKHNTTPRESAIICEMIQHQKKLQEEVNRLNEDNMRWKILSEETTNTARDLNYMVVDQMDVMRRLLKDRRNQMSHAATVKSQNCKLRDENQELYRKLQELGLEVLRPKAFLEQELLDQSARAELLKEVAKGLKSDCGKLINAREFQEGRPRKNWTIEGNHEVDKLEKEIEDNKQTCEFLGAEFGERDMEIEMLIRNDIVDELEREIKELRFQRERLAIAIDLHIGMEIELHTGLMPEPQK